jgi:hypothetical protein
MTWLMMLVLSSLQPASPKQVATANMRVRLATGATRRMILPPGPIERKHTNFERPQYQVGRQSLETSYN